MRIRKSEPINARHVFEWSPRYHFVAGSGVFSVFFAVFLMCSMNPFVAALIAGGAGLALYLYLENWLLVITCPHCRKDINTNTPWLCGFKQCHNENVNEYPFVHECETCHQAPKAYECHHCRRIIPLGSDPQEEQAAKRLVMQPAPIKTVMVVVDPTKDEELRQKLEIRDLTHERDAQWLKHEIKTIKKMPASIPQIKPEFKAAQDRICQRIQKGENCKKTEQDELEKARIKYKDNPEMLQEMELIIREAVFEEMQRLGNNFQSPM